MNIKKDFWMKYHLNFPIAGGNGDSKEHAIVILLDNNLGILLEKDVIACLFCNGDYSFKLMDQQLIQDGDKYYDLLLIKLPNGDKKEVYFDIGNFFGKSFALFKRDSEAYIALLKQMTIRPSAEEEKSWFT